MALRTDLLLFVLACCSVNRQSFRRSRESMSQVVISWIYGTGTYHSLILLSGRLKGNTKRPRAGRVKWIAAEFPSSPRHQGLFDVCWTVHWNKPSVWFTNLRSGGSHGPKQDRGAGGPDATSFQCGVSRAGLGATTSPCPAFRNISKGK